MVKSKKNFKLYEGSERTRESSSIHLPPRSCWFSNTRVIRQSEIKQIDTSVSCKEKDTANLYVHLKKSTNLKSNTTDKYVVTQGMCVGNKILNPQPPQEYGIQVDKQYNLRNTNRNFVANSARAINPITRTKTITPNTNLVNERKQIKHITNKLDKGHSERIWKELFKVIDLSDLIVEVLDARNPSGTRSHYIEQYIKKQSPNKHLIIVLNKCDLVPSYVTKEWLHSISKEFPTVAFHCSVTNPFGKGALLSVLRQISHLKTDKPFLKVCFIGFPNVGKSSVINALKTKEVCKVANRPGETKVWQLVVLMKKLFLLDCPGFVHFNTRDFEVDIIVNGVKRVEKISDASAYLPMILRSVKPHFLQRTYQIRYWSSAEDFITQLAMKSGRIITKGQPDIETSAKMVRNP
jgi:nuclear GTP-binding protein